MPTQAEVIQSEIRNLQSQIAGLRADMQTPGIGGSEKAAIGRAVESLSRQVSARQDALAQLKEGYAPADVREEMGRQISAGVRKEEVVQLKAKGYVEYKGLLYGPGGAVQTVSTGAGVGWLSPYSAQSPFYKTYKVPSPTITPAVTPTITPAAPKVVPLGVTAETPFLQKIRGGAEKILGGAKEFVSPTFYPVLTKQEELTVRAKYPSFLEGWALSRVSQQKYYSMAGEASKLYETISITPEPKTPEEITAYNKLVAEYQFKAAQLGFGEREKVDIYKVPSFGVRAASVVGQITSAPLLLPVTATYVVTSTNKQLVEMIKGIGTQFKAHPIETTAIVGGTLALGWGLSKTVTFGKPAIPKSTIMQAGATIKGKTLISESVISTKVGARPYYTLSRSISKLTPLKGGAYQVGKTTYISVTRPVAWTFKELGGAKSITDLVKFQAGYGFDVTGKLPGAESFFAGGGVGQAISKEGIITTAQKFGIAKGKPTTTGIERFMFRGTSIKPSEINIAFAEVGKAKLFGMKVAGEVSGKFKGLAAIKPVKGFTSEILGKAYVQQQATTASSVQSAIQKTITPVKLKIPPVSGTSLISQQKMGIPQITMKGVSAITKTKQKTITAPISPTIQIPKVGVKQKAIAITIPSFAPSVFTIQKTKQITTPIPRQTQIQIPIQPTRLKLLTITPFVPSITTPTPVMPTFPITRIPIIPTIPPLRFGEFDFAGLGKKFKSGKQFKTYTPSYTALIYKIKGPKPKGIETGLRLRPITPGFSWAKLFKRKKRRKK